MHHFLFKNQEIRNQAQVLKAKISSPRTKNQVQQPRSKSKYEKRLKSPTIASQIKRGEETHQKRSKFPTPSATSMTTTRSKSQAMSTPQPTITPQQPESPSSTPSQGNSGNTPSQACPEITSSQECPLSPGWVHAISTIMSYSLKSEIGQKVQKWVLYHEIDGPTDFWLSCDPTDSEDIRLLQKYTESNGSVV